MVLTDKQFEDPRIAERICRGIDFAFRQPSQSDCSDDSHPIYSIFLLEKIYSRMKDPVSRALIEETLTSIRGKLRKREE